LGMLINYIIPAMLPTIPPRQITKPDPKILDSCVGEYQMQSGQIRVSVFKKGDHLFCRILGKTSQMYPEAGDYFFIPDEVFGDWTFKVVKNDKNEVTSAIGYAAFQIMPFKKIK